MLTRADQIFIGLQTYHLQSSIDEILFELNKSLKPLQEFEEEVLKRDLQSYREGMLHLEMVFCPRYALSKEDVVRYQEEYKTVDFDEFHEELYNHETLTKEVLFGRKMM